MITRPPMQGRCRTGGIDPADKTVTVLTPCIPWLVREARGATYLSRVSSSATRS